MTSLNFQTVALIDAMNDRPIAFNRHYVSLGCGINGALMLSQMVYWSKRTKDKNGYFYKTQDDWEQETGLTRREQETARKRLRELGFVSEHKHGVPCKVHFRVEHDNLYMALVRFSQNSQSSMAEYAKLECTDAPNSDVGISQTNTENTTEITTENKNTFRPEASQPDPQTTEQDFLTRNSDAVVFSAKKRQWGSREDLACAQWIWGRIVGLYEQAASDDGEIMRPKEPNWTAWANDVRTMRMLDGRSHRQICEMFGRVQRDPFWVKNIMSPSKLREKWDELVIRLGRSPVQRCVNHISEPDTEIPPGFRG